MICLTGYIVIELAVVASTVTDVMRLLPLRRYMIWMETGRWG